MDFFKSTTTIDVNFKTKKQCLKEYNDIKRLAVSSTEAELFSVCKNKDCDYIMRVQPLSSVSDVTAKIMIMCSENGIAPEIVNLWTCEVFNPVTKNKFDALFIVMKKYKYTLSEWMKKNRKDWFKNKDELLLNLGILLEKLKELNVAHNDLHAENILLNSINDIVIIDYGRSTFGSSMRDSKDLASDINRILDQLDLPDRINYTSLFV